MGYYGDRQKSDFDLIMEITNLNGFVDCRGLSREELIARRDQLRALKTALEEDRLESFAENLRRKSTYDTFYGRSNEIAKTSGRR